MRRPLEELREEDRVRLQSLQNQIFMMVRKERNRQDKKWGVQRHAFTTWMAILGEEYGESCQATMKESFATKDTDQDDLLSELVQTAAVAIAAAEQVLEERDNWYYKQQTDLQEELDLRRKDGKNEG